MTVQQIQDYYTMFDKVQRGEISQQTWYDYCTGLIFNNVDFISMCVRMKDR